MRIVSPILSLLIAIGAVLYFQQQQPKTAYIEFNKVVENFEMTIELQALMDQELNIRKNEIEAIKAEILALAPEDSVLRNTKGRIVMAKIQKLEEFSQSKSMEINQQIIGRINEYAEQYGKEEELDYLYGANGNGSLMYASEGRNATEEFTNYINQLYADKRN